VTVAMVMGGMSRRRIMTTTMLLLIVKGHSKRSQGKIGMRGSLT
jgi:hypothetical protein